MTQLGSQDGEMLTVDLRSRTLATWDDLWGALMEPCGLPKWFGRNLHAWWDTIQTGAISEVLDEHSSLVVVVGPRGLFGPGNPDGAAFVEVTDRSDYAAVEIHD